MVQRNLVPPATFMGHTNNFLLNKKKNGDDVCLIKAVLQEVTMSEMNIINKDGEGNNGLVYYFWHNFSRDLHLTA